MKIHLFHIRFILLILTGFLVACSPTRRLSEGQYLLVKNHVVQIGENKKEKDDIASYIQQKPNSSFVGIWRFYLQVYNLPNPQKVLLQKENQQQKLEKKIMKLMHTMHRFQKVKRKNLYRKKGYCLANGYRKSEKSR